MQARIQAIHEFKELQRILITDCLTKRERLNELEAKEAKKREKLESTRKETALLMSLKRSDKKENYYFDNVTRRLDVLDDEKERLNIEKFSSAFRKSTTNLKELKSMNEFLKLKIKDLNHTLGGANVLADTIESLRQEEEKVEQHVSSLKIKLNLNLNCTRKLKDELKNKIDEQELLFTQLKTEQNSCFQHHEALQSIVRKLNKSKPHEHLIKKRWVKIDDQKEHHAEKIQDLTSKITVKKREIECHLIKAQKLRLNLKRTCFASKKRKSSESNEKCKIKNKIKNVKVTKVWHEVETLKVNLTDLQTYIKDMTLDVMEKSHQDCKAKFSVVLDKMMSVLVDMKEKRKSFKLS